MFFEPTTVRKVRLEQAGGAIFAEITEGQGPTLVWLCGFGSDSSGTKASYLAQQTQAWGYRFIRFDYRGTGQSGGTFLDMTLSDWLADALKVIDELTNDKVILIGSSMGGWLAQRMIQERPEKIAGLVTVAVATNFAQQIWETELTAAQRQLCANTGVIDGVAAAPVTHKLLQDGMKNHLLASAPLAFDGAAILLHGLQDAAVPPQRSVDLLQRLTTPDAQLWQVKDGDHSLSRPHDLALLWQAVTTVREKVREKLALN